MPLSSLLPSLRSGTDLTPDAVREAADALLCESQPTDGKAEFLRALAAKGESADEIAGFVREFLRHAVPSELDLATLDRPALDVCGTGGDQLHLFNVSTTAMFLLAASGAAVVKHGNRGITSKSGGADVLEALGIRIDLPPAGFAECVKRCGLGFMLAPAWHPAFRVVAPARKILAAEGTRTIFNLIGPLLNPVQPHYQLVGLADATLLPAFAEILTLLGRRHAWAVHGSAGDGRGMDELSILAPSLISATRAGALSQETINPASLGFAPAHLNQLAGGDAAVNAAILEGILLGEIHGPKRDMAVLNAAAGLMITGLAPDWPHALSAARESIDSGRAHTVLTSWRAFAH